MWDIFVFIFSFAFGILVGYVVLKGIIALFLLVYKWWIKRHITNELKYEIADIQTIDTTIVTIYRSDGKYGFYISKNIRGIKPRYDEVRKFAKNMIAVRIDDKWGYVRLKTVFGIRIYEAIPPQYDTVEDFTGFISLWAKAKVTLNGEQFYINNEGKRML